MELQSITGPTCSLDYQDFARASKYRWYYNKKTQKFFTYIAGHTTYLHRFIMDIERHNKTRVIQKFKGFSYRRTNLILQSKTLDVSKMKDLDLCVEYQKSHNEVYMKEMLIRYMPLIKSESYRMFNKLPLNYLGFTFDDCITESQLQLIKAMRYPKKAKIKDIKLFSFGLIVKQYCLAYVCNQIKVCNIREGIAGIRYTNTVPEKSFNEASASKVNTFYIYKSSGEKLTNLEIQKFLKTLEGIELKVATCFMAGWLTSDVRKYTELTSYKLNIVRNLLKVKLEEFAH